VAKIRSRRSTNDLLPSDFSSGDNSEISCPKPEQDLKEYTYGRLQSGLVYAERCMKRNICPRSELFYYIYKQGVKDAMTTTNVAEKMEHIKLVAAQEIFIEKKDYLKPLDTKYAKLQEELLHLRELQYMARYGDYLKIIPNQIRACAKSMKFENWETIGQNSFWTDIAQIIREESLSDDSYKTTSAVRRACFDLGISPGLPSGRSGSTGLNGDGF
jgi:hypothetical protein